MKDDNMAGLTYPAKHVVYQSTQQAFYFIESVEYIQPGDWILAYHGDKLIGSREWSGRYTDVPVMGDDGYDYSAGYIKTGDIPHFKLLKNNKLISLDGDISPFSNNQIYMLSNLRLIPEEYKLSPAYPNPFNPVTTLSFAIPEAVQVNITIYDLQGRQVAILTDGILDAGYHTAVWDGGYHSSGIYFVQMAAGKYINTQKLMLVK